MDIVNRAKNILLTPKTEWGVIANGLFLLYWGLKPMKHVPDDKVTSYFFVALICMVAVSLILAAVMGAVIGIRCIF